MKIDLDRKTPCNPFLEKSVVKELTFALSIITLIGSIIALGAGISVYQQLSFVAFSNLNQLEGLIILGVAASSGIVSFCVLLITRPVCSPITIWAVGAPGEDRKTAVERIVSCFQNKSTTLDLSNLGLSSLPPEIDKLSHLKKLHLDGNNFRSLPKVVCQLASLEELTMRGCRLEQFPEVDQLSFLKVLKLSYNSLQTLPETVVLPESLEQLFMDNNQIVALPKKIHQPSAKFARLSLHFNQLTTFPPVIYTLPGLVSLGLNNNLIESVSKENLRQAAELKIFLLNNPLDSKTLEYLTDSQDRFGLTLPQIFFSCKK